MTTSPPAIARIWRGRTTRAMADEYAANLLANGLQLLVDNPLAVQMFRENREDDTEFVTISWWESVDSMSRFASDDPTRIHHLPRDEEYLIELPEGVQVLEIIASHGITAHARE
ncbi:MAG: antibiotic biosynthesis monooxygenase family protein [Thermomicrobiales bacterium]